MAHQKDQTMDEQILAITSSLVEILKVQDSSVAPMAPQNKQALSTSNNVVSLPTTSSPSILGSSKLALIQFTLAVQPFDDSKAHVVLHLDGTSASASPSLSEDSKIPPLEVIHLGLICDKFPIDSIPSEIVSKDALFLVKFWGDLNFDKDSASQLPALFHVTTIFEGSEMLQVSCKTSVCSFGRSFGDKVERMIGTQVAPNRVVYESVRAPLCDYLADFIHKLKGCNEVATMNGVLENFSVVQVVTDDVTKEMLLCFVYVFEVCPPELCNTTGAMCKVYRLDASNGNPTDTMTCTTT